MAAISAPSPLAAAFDRIVAAAEQDRVTLEGLARQEPDFRESYMLLCQALAQIEDMRRAIEANGEKP